MYIIVISKIQLVVYYQCANVFCTRCPGVWGTSVQDPYHNTRHFSTLLCLGPSFGFFIPWAVFRIPKPRIPDSIGKNIPDSRFHYQKLPRFWNLDSLDGGHFRNMKTWLFLFGIRIQQTYLMVIPWFLFFQCRITSKQWGCLLVSQCGRLTTGRLMTIHHVCNMLSRWRVGSSPYQHKKQYEKKLSII